MTPVLQERFSRDNIRYVSSVIPVFGFEVGRNSKKG
jgi:hypothetical protein